MPKLVNQSQCSRQLKKKYALLMHILKTGRTFAYAAKMIQVSIDEAWYIIKKETQMRNKLHKVSKKHYIGDSERPDSHERSSRKPARLEIISRDQSASSQSSSDSCCLCMCPAPHRQ